MGLLKVNGVIDLDQFWTSGQSDADTVHVKLTDPFLFQSFPNQLFQPTTALDHAEMHNKPVVHKDRNTGAKSITVRLQGIDAPELHYQPQAPANLSAAVKAHQAAFHQQAKDYRQPYGETATVELAKWLRNTYGQQPLPCVVTTQVDTPNEVFDAYGRFIGTIFIPDPHGNEPVPTDDGQETIPATDVNLHIVQQGWAFPTFYSSMTNGEIVPLLQAATQAQAQRLGVWGLYQDHIDPLDTDLIYDRPTQGHTPIYNAANDAGEVIFPKLFRRLCVYTALNKAGIITMTLKEYLQSERDFGFLLSEFLDQGPTASTPHTLDEFLDDNNGTDINGTLTGQPYTFVFQEKPSSLHDGNTGQIIKTW